LVLNATLGWHSADPIAALVIAAVAVKEGIDAWRGDNCCPPMPSNGLVDAGTSAAVGCADDCCQTDLAKPVLRQESK
jgi:hypothetical protein